MIGAHFMTYNELLLYEKALLGAQNQVQYLVLYKSGKQ